MQGEAGSTVEKDIKGLNDLTSVLLASLTNGKITSELSAAEDTHRKAFAAIEHEQLTLKEALNDLLRLEEAELSNLNEARTEMMGGSVTQQLSQLSQANRKKNTLEEEINALRNSIAHNEQLEQQLEQRLKSSTQQTLTAVPKIKANSQIYSQISRLKWDHTTPENVVKGFVIHPQKRDVIPFKIDKSSHSQFFVTNFLWEQIGADSSF